MRNPIVARLHALREDPEAERAFQDGRGMELDEVTAYALGEPQPARGEAESRPETPAAALTQRQLEVARLVAEGMSNKEIAARLHISDRTAEGHVEQACNKLGFASRVQLAAWVIRQEPGHPGPPP
jgi:non-specific serine/threonine protein kinase